MSLFASLKGLFKNPIVQTPKPTPTINKPDNSPIDDAKPKRDPKPAQVYQPTKEPKPIQSSSTVTTQRPHPSTPSPRGHA